MDKEKLIAIGLTEEQAKKVMFALDGNYVEKSRFKEVTEENEALKQTVSDRDKQLETLKKSNGDSAELKKQIEALQEQNKTEKAAHEKEMAQLKLDNAVENALTAAGAKNNKALRALLDTEKIKLDSSGKLEGLEEQLNSVRKSDPYMFNEKETEPTSFKGFQPGASSDVKPDGKADFSKMTYSQMAAYLEQNPGAKIE